MMNNTVRFVKYVFDGYVFWSVELYSQIEGRWFSMMTDNSYDYVLAYVTNHNIPNVNSIPDRDSTLWNRIVS